MAKIKMKMFVRKNNSGVVLLITIVILVILASQAYLLVESLSSQRHRNSYLIDYQKTIYGCDSAIKYALTTIADIKPLLIERPDDPDPDFSDFFHLSQDQYLEALELHRQAYLVIDMNDPNNLDANSSDANSLAINSPDANNFDVNESAQQNTTSETLDYFSDIFGDFAQQDLFTHLGYDSNNPSGELKQQIDKKKIQIKGPYRYSWPLIAEPLTFSIEGTKITIRIEDENAKYPIGWMMLFGEKIPPEIENSFEIFCEWMELSEDEIISLKDELIDLCDIKLFKLEFKNQILTERVQVKSSRGRRRTKINRIKIPGSVHLSSFVRLYHSDMLDKTALGRIIHDDNNRKETALKYISLLGSSKVNINSAPRQVLEASFIFAGYSDAVEIADEIIIKRRETPFSSIDDLKKRLPFYAESIKKCEKYIITASDYFAIHVTATSGKAQTNAIVAVKKHKKKAEPVAVIYY